MANFMQRLVLMITCLGPALASQNVVRREIDTLEVTPSAKINFAHHPLGGSSNEASSSLSGWEPHPFWNPSPPQSWRTRKHGNTSASLVALDCSETCKTVTACPELEKVLKKYQIRPPSEVPSEYELQTKYAGHYTKYINVLGVPVLSSDKVCDCVLQKAAWIAHGTLSHFKRWHEVVEKMKQQKSRLAIMADTEVTSDIPEHSRLMTDHPSTDWDARCRGIGATPSVPASSGAEENIMCEPSSKDGYFGENILLHEFIHGIARTGLAFLKWNGGESWDDYNGALFEAATRRVLWKNTYAGSNKIEYFAEAAQMWFDAQSLPQCCDPSQLHAQCGLTKDTSLDCCHNGVHNCADTREKLKRYDPHLYNRLNALLTKDSWTPGKGNSCGCGLTDYEEGFVSLNEGGAANVNGEVLEPPADECHEQQDTVCRARKPQCKWDSTQYSCEKDCTFFENKPACAEDAFCHWSGECQIHCNFVRDQSGCVKDGLCTWSGGKCEETAALDKMRGVAGGGDETEESTGTRRRRTRRRRRGTGVTKVAETAETGEDKSALNGGSKSVAFRTSAPFTPCLLSALALCFLV